MRVNQIRLVGHHCRGAVQTRHTSASSSTASLTLNGNPTSDDSDTLKVVARLERLRELVDRLHPSGLLYATYEHRLIAELITAGCRDMSPCSPTATNDGHALTRRVNRWWLATRPEREAQGVRRVVRRARHPGGHVVGAVDRQLLRSSGGRDRALAPSDREDGDRSRRD